MANRVQHLRHTVTDLANFTGLVAEVTVNLANNTVVVHDGITPGGHEMALADLENVNGATISISGKMTDQHVRDLALALANTVQNAANIALNVTDIANNLASINNLATLIAQNTTDISSLTGGQGAYLLLAGGTMTGVLELAADPVGNLEASTKQYTDAGDTAAENNAKTYADGLAASLNASKANRAGDTFTGPVILSGAPTVPQGAATKQWVEGEIAAVTAGLVRTPGDIPHVYIQASSIATPAYTPAEINTALQIGTSYTRICVFTAAHAGLYRVKLGLAAENSSLYSNTGAGNRFLVQVFINNVYSGQQISTNIQTGAVSNIMQVPAFDLATPLTPGDKVDLRARYTPQIFEDQPHFAGAIFMAAEIPVSPVIIPEPFASAVGI